MSPQPSIAHADLHGGGSDSRWRLRARSTGPAGSSQAECGRGMRGAGRYGYPRRAPPEAQGAAQALGAPARGQRRREGVAADIPTAAVRRQRTPRRRPAASAPAARPRLGGGGRSGRRPRRRSAVGPESRTSSRRPHGPTAHHGSACSPPPCTTLCDVAVRGGWRRGRRSSAGKETRIWLLPHAFVRSLHFAGA